MTPAPTDLRQIAPDETVGATPSPMLFMETVRAFQRSAAIKAAIELDLFTTMADGPLDAEAIAARCGAARRGIRILSDYLASLGFLVKDGARYALTHDTFVFLNRRSPAYIGGTIEFQFLPDLLDSFWRLAGTIRRGTREERGLAAEDPMWVTFARAMAPAMRLAAENLADLVGVADMGPIRVLDIAAGHGLFGIAVARRNPAAEIVALDWAPVLEVARENATAAGVASRHRTIAGNAMTENLGSSYNLVLLTNFLHHFDERTIVAFLRKVHAALADSGRVAALEFVPDEDRLGPASAASFPLTMLAMTSSGDAYTFSQYQRMFSEAGFHDIALHPFPPTPERVVTATR